MGNAEINPDPEINPRQTPPGDRRRRPFGPGRFGVLVLLGILLLDLLVGTWIGLSLVDSRQRFIDSAEVKSQNLARAAAQGVYGTLDRIDHALLTVRAELRRSVAADAMDGEAIDRLVTAQAALLPEGFALRVAGADGVLRVGRGLAGERRVDIADRAFFAELRDLAVDRLVVSRPIRSRVTQQWVIILGRRVSGADGAFAGALFGTLPVAHLQAMLDHFDAGAGGVITLRDGELGLIARNAGAGSVEVEIGNQQISQELRAIAASGAAETHYSTTTPYDQVRRRFTVIRLDRAPMFALAGLAERDFLAPWYAQVKAAAAIFAFFLLFTGAGGWVIARLWTRQVAVRTQLEEMLREREYLSAIFESTDDSITAVTLDGDYTRWNKGAEKLFGYAAAEMIGRSIFSLLPPSELPLERQRLARVARGESVTGVEAARLHRDGHVVYVSLSISPIRSLDGRVIGASRIAHDLTARRAAEQALRRSEENFRTLVEGLPFGASLIDADQRVAYHNPAFTLIFGYTIADVPDLATWFERAFPDTGYRELVVGEWRNKVIGSPEHHTVVRVFDVHRRDGEARTIRFAMVKQADGRVLVTYEDVSEHLRAEQRLRVAASVFEASQEGVLVTDATTRIIDVNPAFTRLTGYTREEAIGQTPRLLRSGHHDGPFFREMWRSLRETGAWRGEIWNRRKNGEVFPELLSINAVLDADERLLHYVAVFTDISQIKEHEAELDRIAHFDTLTGIPNRRLLADRMAQATARVRRSGKLLAVCYLDLDGFKPVNDELGHEAGDQLLVYVVDHLKAVLRADDTLARLGGDEFVILLNDLEDTGECRRIVERTLEAIRQPMRVQGHEVSVSASIGVTLFPDDAVDADTLLRHADQAMYVAKESGKNRFQLFDPAHERRAAERRETARRLAEALSGDEFELFYQPKVDLRSGAVIGAEALIRWRHPQRGVLAPAEFLPALVGTPLEMAVGEWVLRQALARVAAWHTAGLGWSASINVGAAQLLGPGFVPLLREVLAGHPQLPPDRLELEILESAAIDDLARASRVLNECVALGVGIAIDDFGTGYASLTWFRKLPAALLKIDRSFVRDMLDDPEDARIVDSVVRLARTFRCEVIAEGVETFAHGAALLDLGCYLVQGYAIARPMPAAELPGWLVAWQGDRAWEKLAGSGVSRKNLQVVSER